MEENIIKAYSTRAQEYITALGSVKDMHEQDISSIINWGTKIAGPILDAGSGPGHWSGLLQSYGCDIRGIDMVPEFVDSASRRFPLVNFEIGDILNTAFNDSSFGGVLAWYSLIHLQPESRKEALIELGRVLRPGGTILLGAFLGPQGEKFDHAIAEAFYWSEAGIADDLEPANFQVISTHVRSSEDTRPHLEVLAQFIGAS